MPIEFNCPCCEKLLRTSEDKAGASARCPECGEAVRVPRSQHDRLDLDFDVDDDEVNDAGDAYSERGGAAAPARATKTCPMCGERIRAHAVKCRYCGEYLQSPRSLPAGSYLQPHRGGAILALAILGWLVCFPFGIAALVMANTDLAEIRAGRMDPQGESLTQAGRIVALVQVVLLVIGVLFFCLFAAIGAAL